MLSFLFASYCNGQNASREPDLSALADNFFGYQESGDNSEEAYDNMVQLLNDPLDLNHSSADNFRFLNFLSDNQINEILKYREKSGPFLSVYELQVIPGLDVPTIQRLLPFVTVRPGNESLKGFIHDLVHKDNNYFVMRIERTVENKRGYREPDSDRQFRGSANRLYYRLRSSVPDNYSIGITAEKDAGEQFRWNPKARQFGFDYWSGHIRIQNRGIIKNLIVGDFQNQFGQGLIFGGAFGGGKGAETVIGIRKSSIGFVPYSSVNESSFCRGVASTLNITSTLQLSAFYSASHRDATLLSDTVDQSISSMSTSGMHRSIDELETRAAIRERQIGLAMSYKHKLFDAGLTYHKFSLSSPLKRNENQYNQFSFSGSTNHNVGAFLNFNLSNFSFFSEAATTVNFGSAIIFGAIGSLSNRISIAFLYRNYSRSFHPFNSNALAESSTPQNEAGIYWGWKYQYRKYTLSGYVDLFRFPWLRFRSYAPSFGYEWFVRLNYQPAKAVQIFAQMREESKMRNRPDMVTMYEVGSGLKRNYVVNFDYGISPTLRMKTRAQFSTWKFDGIQTDGFVLIQDLSCEIKNLTLTGRYAMFGTDDYDNRQYAFENDVWLAYSSQAYYGEGVRKYILVEYRISKAVSVWARFASYRYDNQESIGSGLETITGNRRNDIKFQLRIKF